MTVALYSSVSLCFICHSWQWWNVSLINVDVKFSRSHAQCHTVHTLSARLVTGIGLRDHVTPALQQLHWLPVQYRITFKLCLLMHKIYTNRAPSYLTDKVTATADLQSRAGLRSASTSKYQIPRTRIKFGERSFSYVGPSTWNSLPYHVWRNNWHYKIQKTI